MAATAPATEHWARICAVGRHHPARWVELVLGVTLTPDQRVFLDSLATHRRVHLRACHSTGKTYALACAVLWYGCCFRPCRIITTAAVGRQVSRQLWGTLPKLFREAQANNIPLPGHIGETPWWQIDTYSNAVGFSTDHPDRFTGEHDENMFFAIDEGHGVSSQIMLGVKTSLQGPTALCVFSGNPIRCEGAFFDEYKSGSWHCVKMDAWTHPNVVHDDPTLFPGAVTLEWIAMMAKDYGEASAEYIGRVCGEFPEGADYGLFPLAVVEAAIERGRNLSPQYDGSLRLGVDVAWQGEDLTVFCIRDGLGVRHMESAQKQDPIWTGDVAASLSKQWGVSATNITVDMTGIGSGTVAHMHRNLEVDARGIHFGGGAYDDETYMNVRAEMYLLASKALREGFALPDHKLLADELKATPYTYDKDGRFKLPDKEGIRKLLGRSPDYADALALTFVHIGANWVL